jgi:hypothetical protein
MYVCDLDAKCVLQHARRETGSWLQYLVKVCCWTSGRFCGSVYLSVELLTGQYFAQCTYLLCVSKVAKHDFSLGFQ